MTMIDLAWSTSRIGMPETGEPGSAGGRVGDVVGADHEGDVAAVELGVDLVHLLELGVGHVGLGQQDVHVARHPAGDRVDGVLHVDAARLEQLGQLADLRAGPGRPPGRSPGTTITCWA